MRKAILFLSGGAALFLFACLVAPNEPSGTSANALTCATDERAFNGSCRKVCTATAGCGTGLACMNVGTGVALCLNYGHCAYLSSDTKCAGANVGYSSYGGSSGDYYGNYGSSGDYYGNYGSSGDYYGGWVDYGYGAYTYPGYGESSFYTYGGVASTAGCAGDGTWNMILPDASAAIECGQQHAVTRCAPVGPGLCGLVAGTTLDVADP